MSYRGLARHNAKRDAGERLIIQALQAQGFAVAQISGKGIPDLLVSKRPDFVRLVEVKAKDGTLTPAQVTFRDNWQGHPIVTLRSVDEALKFGLRACKAGTSGGSRP